MRIKKGVLPMKTMKTVLTLAVIFSLILTTTIVFAGSFEYVGEDLLRPIQKKAISAMFAEADIDLEKADVEIFGELVDDMPGMEGLEILFVTTTMLYKGRSFTDRGGLAKRASFEITKRTVADVIKEANEDKGFE